MLCNTYSLASCGSGSIVLPLHVDHFDRLFIVDSAYASISSMLARNRLLQKGNQVANLFCGQGKAPNKAGATLPGWA